MTETVLMGQDTAWEALRYTRCYEQLDVFTEEHTN